MAEEADDVRPGKAGGAIAYRPHRAIFHVLRVLLTAYALWMIYSAATDWPDKAHRLVAAFVIIGAFLYHFVRDDGKQD